MGFEVSLETWQGLLWADMLTWGNETYGRGVSIRSCSSVILNLLCRIIVSSDVLVMQRIINYNYLTTKDSAWKLNDQVIIYVGINIFIQKKNYYWSVLNIKKIQNIQTANKENSVNIVEWNDNNPEQELTKMNLRRRQGNWNLFSKHQKLIDTEIFGIAFFKWSYEILHLACN